MVTPAAERNAVAHLISDYGMSEWRACKTIGSCRMTMRYRTTRQDDTVLRQRIKAIAQERRRFGYRRVHVLLKREGFLVNHKRLFRLYREERLAVRRRDGRKRASGTRAPMTVPTRPNDRWSLDFVSDQLTDGRRFRILAIVDDCTRECLALASSCWEEVRCSPTFTLCVKRNWLLSLIAQWPLSGIKLSARQITAARLR